MYLRLVGEAKVDTEGRVDVALKLSLLGEIVRVIVEQLHILSVKIDNLSVGLDAVRVDRLGEDGAATGDLNPVSILVIRFVCLQSSLTYRGS